ncbi:hypothetical protein [Azorhizobium caulinodans]|uniref:hypothetical protein n=1 Tax=Azorhizobium caulinodans TaxID=7 RepID=UPI002FBEA0B1
MKWPASALAITGTVVVITLAHGSAAHAQADFKLLAEKDIRARVVGKDITDSSHWASYLRPDGKLLSDEMGRTWSGVWEIRKGRLCMSNPTSATLDCYEVWMSGPTIRLRGDKGEETLDAVVERHQSRD